MRNVLLGGPPLTKFDWYYSLFSSVESYPIVIAAVTIESGMSLQTSYLQAEQFRRSVLRGYAAYALQLMYDGKYNFSFYLHPQRHPNPPFYNPHSRDHFPQRRRHNSDHMDRRISSPRGNLRFPAAVG
jgi:hypothetical protein